MSEQERNRLLEQGRAAYSLRAWDDAYAALSAADEQTPLQADDVERLTWSAGLTGRDQICLSGLERLYQLELTRAPLRAAHWAFWCGYRLLSLGELGRGSGWLQRAQRLVEQAPDECAVVGYLLLAEVRRHFVAGEYAQAEQSARRALHIAERFHERDLAALARNLLARVLLFQGQIEAGLALLDEALLSAAGDELSTTVSGLVYCTGLESCRAVCALDRAREWSQALSRWCEAQPQLITFNNACLAYRAEMLQLGGALQQAVLETQRISERAALPNRREGAGECFYQLGELQRPCGPAMRSVSCTCWRGGTQRAPHAAP
jgi:tetratricopeptide (TPR) repeat protein